MDFKGLFLLFFFLRDVVIGVPLKRRVSNAKFINISRDAFKKLNSEVWQGSELTDDDGKELFDETKNLKHPKLPPLNATKLKKLLGEGYDAQFMTENKPGRTLLETKNQLNLQTEFDALKHGEGGGDAFSKILDEKRISLNQVEFEDVRFLLWNLTRCTVEPLWKDFGSNVWPRYVNLGKCSGKPTCSIPSGMKCRPSEEKNLRLLYWFCPKNAKRCYWTSFGTKVIRTCSCSC